MSKDLPLISVVVPAHNHARYLPETIGSVSAQTFGDLEIIVLDNGSTDETREVVEQLEDPRIKYHYQEDSGLPANSRNNAVKLARGDWIAFLDSDDIWLPEKLAKQLAVAEMESAELICTNAMFFDSENGRELGLAHPRSDAAYGFEDEFLKNRVVCSSVLVKRSLFTKCGAFSEDKGLRGVEDHDLWLRVAQRTKLYYVGEPLVRYRIHADNLSADEAKNLERELLIFERWKDKVGPSVRRYRLSRIMFSMGRALLAKNDRQSVKMFRQAALTANDPRAWVVSILSRLPFPVFRTVFTLAFRARSGKSYVHEGRSSAGRR